MDKTSDEKIPQGMRDRRVYMANERTFLAWIRTSIAIMAFGFVVEKFSLFVKQMAIYLGKEAAPPSPGYSPIMGIIIVCFGLAMGVMSFYRYKIVEKQITDDTYQSSVILSVMLFISVLAIGVFLIFYLVNGL
jgi:uncharacterized membrane protein YidH (DUF202 family)